VKVVSEMTGARCSHWLSQKFFRLPSVQPFERKEGLELQNSKLTGSISSIKPVFMKFFKKSRVVSISQARDRRAKKIFVANPRMNWTKGSSSPGRIPSSARRTFSLSRSWSL